MRRDGLKVQRGMSCRSDGAGVCMDAGRGEGGWVGGDTSPRDEKLLSRSQQALLGGSVMAHH